MSSVSPAMCRSSIGNANVALQARGDSGELVDDSWRPRRNSL